MCLCLDSKPRTDNLCSKGGTLDARPRQAGHLVYGVAHKPSTR